MTGIRCRGVSVVYELLSVADYNLKRRMITGVGRRRMTAKRTQIVALDDLDLDLTPGTRLGVVGSNGAGKSTLLRVLAGALPPTRGQVRIEGSVLSLLGSSGTGLDFGLTGYENVIISGVLLGQSPRAMRARMAEIAEFSGLGDRLKTPVGTYSTGMQARLRFSILTSLRPEILLMDEGVATADAAFAVRAQERLEAFQGAAEIVVVSSHSSSIKSMCRTAIWLEAGAIVDAGPVQTVLDNYAGAVRKQTQQGWEGANP